MSWKSNPETAAIEDVIERWARVDRAPQQLHPLRAMELMHDGAVLGGGCGAIADDEKAFDECYCEAPPHDQRVVDYIYRKNRNAPVSVIASRLGWSRTRFYEEQNKSLSYFRGAMRSKGFKV